MKNGTRHTVKVPFDLDAQIQKKRIEGFEKDGTMPSFGELLVEYARIGINGNDPERIVSKQSKDTDSAEANYSVPDTIEKNVSPVSEDTISKAYQFNLD